MGVHLIHILLFAALFLWAGPAHSKTLICGIARGFPPYQFQKDDQPAGFDVDVIRLVFDRLDQTYEFVQADWDHVFNQLRAGRIDLIAGIEINALRKNVFDFTSPYHHRYDVVFIREDDQGTNTIQDLRYSIITGDRHSFVENYWAARGMREQFRIMHTESKEASMRLLGSGQVRAAIMPRAVGFYLARELGFQVKVLISPDPGSPVAMAVKKGNLELLEKINTALQELIREGKIKPLEKEWL